MTANLTVANKSNGETFSVSIKGDLTIKNHKHNGELTPGEVRTTVKNGKVTNFYCQPGDKKNTPQRALNLSSTKYNIFNKLRTLDGNANDLSQKDLQLLKQNKALQKQLGIFAVRYDAEAKVTGIYTSANDSNPFMFDFD